MKRYLLVAFAFVVFVMLLIVYSFAGQEGRVGNNIAPADQSLASIADWYTTKTIIGTAVVVIATSYPGYLLKSVYNNCSDSAAWLWGITAAGDTLKIKVNKLSSSGKLPVITTVLGAATSDSLIYFFQTR
jgi:hypothetical protein